YVVPVARDGTPRGRWASAGRIPRVPSQPRCARQERGELEFSTPFVRYIVSLHEPHPLIPSFSPSGGEGARRAVEGDSDRFMVPKHAQMRKEAFHEPAEFRVRAPIESGGGPPHSSTLARLPQSLELTPGSGVRRPCGAL